MFSHLLNYTKKCCLFPVLKKQSKTANKLSIAMQVSNPVFIQLNEQEEGAQEEVSGLSWGGVGGVRYSLLLALNPCFLKGIQVPFLATEALYLQKCV